MKKGRMCSIIALAALLVLGAAIWASADDWVLLGTRTVALGADRDEIWVGEGMGTFKAIKLHVVDRGVEFDRLLVAFRNGRTVEAGIRAFIPAGGYTRDIDLPGRERFISRVVMYYTTRPGTLDRAVVEVWGLRD